MKLAKRIYLGLLGLWLLACGVRALLPWLGNYQDMRFASGAFYTSAHDCNEAAGTLPASIFAELNKRLEATQPDTLFFLSPWEECGDYRCQALILKSVSGEAPMLSPAAGKVVQEWEAETGIRCFMVVQD